MKQIRVTLVKSTIGCTQRVKDIVRSLGLGKLNSSAVHCDTPTIRGMINNVAYLVRVD